MAAQDYHTISQPSFGIQDPTLNLVVKKSEKKDQKMLAQLAAVLKAVEADLGSAKLGSPKSEKGSEASGTNFEDVMAEMTGDLQALQIKLAKFAQGKAAQEAEISTAEMALAQQNLKHVLSSIKHMEHEAAHEKKAHFWEEFAGIVAGALMILSSPLTGGGLAIAGIMTILGATGAFSAAAKGIASDIVADDPKIGRKKAMLIAEGIVAAVTIVVTAGAGSVAGLGSVAADAVEATEEVATTIAEKAVQVLRLVARTVMRPLTYIFEQIGPKATLVVMSTIQALTSSGFVGTLTSYCMQKDKNANKDEIEAAVNAAAMVFTVIVSIAAGSVISSGISSGAAVDAEEGASGYLAAVRQSLSKFKDFGLSSWSQRFIELFRQSALGVQAGAGIAAADYQIKQGVQEIDLSGYRADTILDNLAIQMNSTEMGSSQHFIAQREKEFKTSDRAVQGMMKGEQAFANLLTNYSAV